MAMVDADGSRLQAGACRRLAWYEGRRPPGAESMSNASGELSQG